MRLDILAVNTRVGPALQEHLEERVLRLAGRGSVAVALLQRLVDRVVVRVEELKGPIDGRRTARCRLEIKLTSGRWLDFAGVGPSTCAAIDHATSSAGKLLRRELILLEEELSTLSAASAVESGAPAS